MELKGVELEGVELEGVELEGVEKGVKGVLEGVGGSGYGDPRNRA